MHRIDGYSQNQLGPIGAEENEKKSSPAVATELCFGFGHTRGRVLEIGFFRFRGKNGPISAFETASKDSYKS